jgi:hypothetical protein
VNFYIEASQAVGTPYQAQGYSASPFAGTDLLDARFSLYHDVDWTQLQQVAYP